MKIVGINIHTQLSIDNVNDEELIVIDTALNTLKNDNIITDYQLIQLGHVDSNEPSNNYGVTIDSVNTSQADEAIVIVKRIISGLK